MKALPCIVALALLAPACSLDVQGRYHLADAGGGEEPDRDGAAGDARDAREDLGEPGGDEPPGEDAGEEEGEGEDAGCGDGGPCDDREPCNGTESCGDDGRCMPGEPPAEGERCLASDGQQGTCVGLVCTPGTCGDGVRDEGEECDDGNRDDRDACTSRCEDAACGDGIVRDGVEECDPPAGAAIACETSCGSAGTRFCVEGCAWGACVPPPEACNGTDDDCDGIVDMIHARVTDDPAESGYPSLAAMGAAGLGVAWTDARDGNREVYFAIVGPDGRKAVADRRITSTGESSFAPVLSWSGTIFGAAWTEGPNNAARAVFTTIRPDGTKGCGDVAVSGPWKAEIFLDIAWGGGGAFGVSWTDTRVSGQWDVYFRKVGATCATLVGESNITPAPNGSGRTTIAWAGTEYGIAWKDNRAGNWEVMFARVNAYGTRLAPETRVTSALGDADAPSLVWTGIGYGVAWSDNRDGNSEIYFARVSPSGVKLNEEDLRITSGGGDSVFPSLAWDGGGYGLAWRDTADGNPEIYFVRLSTDGTKLAAPVRVTATGVVSDNPSLAWSGSEYVVAWMEQEAAGTDIRLALLGCY